MIRRRCLALKKVKNQRPYKVTFLDSEARGKTNKRIWPIYFRISSDPYDMKLEKYGYFQIDHSRNFVDESLLLQIKAKEKYWNDWKGYGYE